jgi:hypothetical protein
MKMYDIELLTPTSSQKAALPGPTGYPPSLTNPYVTLNYIAFGIPVVRKQILAPEYEGGVLWNGGVAPVSATLTTDYELGSDSFGYNFYKWVSTAGAFETYFVVVRWRCPDTFVIFNQTPTAALRVDFATEDITGADSRARFTYGKDNALGVTSSTGWTYGNVSGTWYSDRVGNIFGMTVGGLDPILATFAAGDVLLVKIEMQSRNNKYVKIGDITIQYTG